MFCAARGAVRNAKQKKTVPAKNSEAIFWRPRFTWPLRAGKRANAHFACSEGFFLSGVPRHMAGWPFLRGQPLLCGLLCPVPRRFFCKRCIRAGILWHRLSCLPAVRFVCAVLFCFGCLFACRAFCAHIFLLSFAFFLFGFCLSNFFSFVAQAATGLYFLPKRK